MEVIYLWPSWMTGSYHRRLARELSPEEPNTGVVDFEPKKLLHQIVAKRAVAHRLLSLCKFADMEELAAAVKRARPGWAVAPKEVRVALKPQAPSPKP